MRKLSGQFCMDAEKKKRVQSDRMMRLDIWKIMEERKEWDEAVQITQLYCWQVHGFIGGESKYSWKNNKRV